MNLEENKAIYCPTVTNNFKSTGMAWDLLSFHNMLLPRILFFMSLQISSCFLLLKSLFTCCQMTGWTTLGWERRRETRASLPTFPSLHCFWALTPRPSPWTKVPKAAVNDVDNKHRDNQQHENLFFFFFKWKK